MDWSFVLVLAFVCCGFTMCLAEAKGLSLGWWGFVGFFFGPIALLAAIGMPDKKLHRFLRQFAEYQGMEPETFSGKPMAWAPVDEAWAEPEHVRERKPRDLDKP